MSFRVGVSPNGTLLELRSTAPPSVGLWDKKVHLHSFATESWLFRGGWYRLPIAFLRPKFPINDPPRILLPIIPYHHIKGGNPILVHENLADRRNRGRGHLAPPLGQGPRKEGGGTSPPPGPWTLGGWLAHTHPTRFQKEA